MKVTNSSSVPVYTVAGSSTSRALPDWLVRKKGRHLKDDPEWANRVELLQDFAFEEASSCVRVSEDGNWVMSTGTYKPQIHVHYLPHLSLSFSRHTDTLNKTFLLLSSDCSKSLHLQTDRSLEFHMPHGRHYFTRLPRYGRDLKYDKRVAEALVPSVGLNADGRGEIFRLNLELGRFVRGYEVDLGSNEAASLGTSTTQGEVDAGSVNVAAIAENSHNLLAFGTSQGTVEFCDPRSRSPVGVLRPATWKSPNDGPEQITALDFHPSGLTLAAGTSAGVVRLYDLRSRSPMLKKDQGYGYPIQTLKFLDFKTTSRAQSFEAKILSSDKRILKIWNSQDGTPWTSVEPEVDMNHVEWCPDSGMFLTANEGQRQHAFLIPQLGPAPRWCSFLDNLVEEMAESPDDPNAFGNRKAGEVYDNYKFLTMPQLSALNLDHLIGSTALLRPYMHGYFVAQALYEEAKVIANPELWREQRAKRIQDKIEKARDSRIRGARAFAVKVNRKLAEKITQREEKRQARKARPLNRADHDHNNEVNEPVRRMGSEAYIPDRDEAPGDVGGSILTDMRFSNLFQDEDFEVDETSREYRSINPVTVGSAGASVNLTRSKEQAFAEKLESSSADASEHSKMAYNGSKTRKVNRMSTADYRKTGHRPHNPSSAVSPRIAKSVRKEHRSFGSMASSRKDPNKDFLKGVFVGEKMVTYAAQKRQPAATGHLEGQDRERRSQAMRRSASGNAFRRI